MPKANKTSNSQTVNQSNGLRDGSLRYLGYAHIFGEILRRWISRQTLNITYATTTAYILVDAVSQCNKTCENDGCGRQTVVKAGDVLIWHSIASIWVPSFIINRVKWGTEYWLMNAGASKALRLNLPIAVGLLSIPMIIHPIDRLANYIMDETYRKYIE